jgi:hypothetical protein
MGLAVLSLGWLAVSDVAGVGTGGNTASLDAVLLVDGQMGSACVNDRVFASDASAMAGVSLTSSTSCRSELAVFTPLYAMWLRRGISLPDVGGMTGASFEPLVQPLLNIWVPPSASWTSEDGLSAARWAAVSAKLADVVFRKNRIGIAFKVSLREYTGVQQSTVGNGCAHLDAVMAAGPPLYDPRFVNVYYVKAIEGWYRGYNCFESGAGNVVYVSLTGTPEVNTTLAHELGHAFGLQRSVGHINPGEFGATSSFVTPEQNLMYNTTLLSIAGAQRKFSLGQAYRMNVAWTSWINQPVVYGTTAGSLRHGVKKICGDDPAPGECPALWLKWP